MPSPTYHDYLIAQLQWERQGGTGDVPEDRVIAHAQAREAAYLRDALAQAAQQTASTFGISNVLLSDHTRW